jgi:hypothetical protein
MKKINNFFTVFLLFYTVFKSRISKTYFTTDEFQIFVITSVLVHLQ